MAGQGLEAVPAVNRTSVIWKAWRVLQAGFVADGSGDMGYPRGRTVSSQVSGIGLDLG